MRQKFCVISLIGLASAVVVLAYLLFDAAISLDHLRSAHMRISANCRLLAGMVNEEWRGKEKATLAEHFRRRATVKDDGDVLWINTLAFTLRGNHINGVAKQQAASACGE